MLLSVVVSTCIYVCECTPDSAQGGTQRTPFWDDGAPVFLTPERRGLGKATGRTSGCRDQPFNIRMESAALHAYIDFRVHSLHR